MKNRYIYLTNKIMYSPSVLINIRLCETSKKKKQQKGTRLAYRLLECHLRFKYVHKWSASKQPKEKKI